MTKTTNNAGRDPVHQLVEPERCYECHADGVLDDQKCFVCGGEGGWQPGWYFYNEVWADRYGPYASEEEAQQKCREYAEQL